MNIPLVDLKAQYAPLKGEILSGIEHILEGMQLFLGENVRSLESEFARFCTVKHAIGVSSGTDALHMILRAMEIGPGDEVITVSHTFIATAEAILLAGARPMFVDINPDTFLMDVDQIQAAITPRTRAILPVHLYGQMADMDTINRIARHYGLWVIEDACQAHGAEQNGHRAGILGDAAAFSFYFSKNLGGYGEGGMITTNNDELNHKLRMLRDHGSSQRYHHEMIGWNARLDEIQALVLRVKLPYLEAWNDQRRAHAAQYDQLLNYPPIIAPLEAPGNRHVYHLYVIRVPERDQLQAHLKEAGIFTGIHYPIPIHLQSALAFLGYEQGSLPVTEMVANQILSLPMYAELSVEQIDTVCLTVKEFVQRQVEAVV